MELREGYKHTEIGVIPEDWEVKLLEEVSEFSNGKAHEQAIDENGEFVVVNSKFISTAGVVFKNSNHAISPLKKGDITMVMSDIPNGKALAKCYLIEKDNRYTLNQRICSIKTEVCDNEFLYYILNRNKYFLSFDSGSGQTNLRRKEVLDCPLALPPTKTEQTAIATALSDADALINSLEKLIAKKRNIKQGAMQQLLKPKEGWEVKKLGEVIYLQGGYAFKSELFTNVGVPIIRISDVGNNKVETDNSVCYEPFNIPKEFVAKKGDVLIAMSGATTGKIGVYNYDGIAYINQRVGKFVVLNQNETSQEFISHIVRSEKFKENLTKEIAQGAQPNISGKQIQSIVLPIPNEKEEQDRIATILSDMDAEIAALETKLEKYRKIKLGMMQNLLTGKIRLV